jgi:ABC-type transport system involved in Fe-S cluster assembly fused permease/ATPase subunit
VKYFTAEEREAAAYGDAMRSFANASVKNGRRLPCSPSANPRSPT